MAGDMAKRRDMLCGLCFLLAVLNLAWTLRGWSGRPDWFKHGPAMAALLDEHSAQRAGEVADPPDAAVVYWQRTFRNPPPAVDIGSLMLAALLTISTAVPLVLPLLTRRTQLSAAETPE